MAMAKSGSSCHVHGLFIFGLLVLVQRSAASQFTVGGKSGWTVPPDNRTVYNQWAETMRFKIGDSLLFVYPASSDSVLRETKEDYDNCSTSSYIAKYTDGHTVFTFNQSGPYYFISGNRDSCLKNEKLVVVVLAERTKSAPPSPAPAAHHPPSSPPSPAAEPPPSPPPPPPPNGAASFAAGVIGSVGAFALSSLLVAF
ncbi:hypothetical protein Nepgr_016257 [Nepenthes gracilis]|uniref:Phytocyanin domain-containing protein n=1 Tax=Nepenthes gracilis TaxID=150966 RepID=A0AAD3XS41_NEPGR|nr:hypothetical protein Nepgr_016257 [Nepenthes gracilis]